MTGDNSVKSTNLLLWVYIVLLYPSFKIAQYCTGNYGPEDDSFNLFVGATIFAPGITFIFRCLYELIHRAVSPEYRKEVKALCDQEHQRKSLRPSLWKRFQDWTVRRWGVSSDSGHDNRPPMPPNISL